MKKLIYYSIIIGLVFSLIFSASAHALSLDQAKANGLVGELQTGYLGIVNQTTPEVRALVDRINQERKGKYGEIAKKNGTSLGAVEALAAKKAIEQTAPGNYVQRASGEWVKR